MNTVVEILNAAGRAFAEFALPMLIQSSLLILILLAVDALLRRKVRAVFRYWIWMLVLAKLVLPPSLGSPVSLGTWFGDTLQAPAVSLLEPEPIQPAEAAGIRPPVYSLQPPASGLLPPTSPLPGAPDESVEVEAPVVPQTSTIAPPAAVTLNWQGLLLVIWAVVAFSLTLLLIQRAFFVRGLLGQSDEANRTMLSELEDCRQRLGLRRQVALRLSPNATSPAVCGLLRPVILIPQSIVPRLQSQDLQAVLLHELAHVKRGDLWINLIQTLLQIAYFYNPLLWLANAMIRRTREQAVDETVLVAMGETAAQYPETLVNIAKLAFTRRPTLSLRLIGVVESKSALTARIKHILTRPIPKSARLGIVGLVAVLILAAVLLPMAEARQKDGDTILSRLAILPNCGVWTSDINGHDLPVLDLASEKIVVLPGVQKEYDLVQMTEARGEGDILYYYDGAKNAAKITFLRRAGLHGEPVSSEYETVTITPMQMPLETTVTTRGGKRFRISVVRTDAEACSIRFHPLGGAPLAFKAILPDDKTVELVGVCEYPSEGKQWWRPDGEVLKEVPWVRHKADQTFPEPEERAYEFAFRFSRPDGLDLQWQAEGSPGHMVATPHDRTGRVMPDMRLFITRFPKTQQTTQIRIATTGLADPSFNASLSYAIQFNGISLRPRQTTDVQVTGRAGKVEQTGIILPEADKRSVILDLATGELVPLPGTGPEPQKIQQALRELGKGDILYDVDLGDRTLIFLRDSKSEPPGEETGEPAVTGHLIKNLPETITAVTKEGRRYKVTILATDEKGCTLKYSPLPADRGAGGGVPVEPKKADGVLEFRIVPGSDDLASGLADEYRKALIDGRMPTDGRYRWAPVRPGVNTPFDSITVEHDGQRWLLLWNEPSHAMLAEQDWALKDVYKTTDPAGRPTAGLILDEKGAELFHKLTQANVKKSLAIVLDGEVLSAPMVMFPISGGQCVIVGNFTDEEVRQIMAVLKKGMADRRTPQSAQTAQFRVHGTVTDVSGRPMAGVEVNVDCGFEKLRRADRAFTDENGRYALDFKPAMYVADADPYGVGIQPAFVWARKDGFYETSLRHKGNLALAGKKPGPDEQRFVSGRAGIVLPHEPYELDFTLAPAARIEGRLVDDQDKPLATRMVSFLSRGMYPSNRVFETGLTDGDGRFAIDNVPCTSFSLLCPHTDVAWSREIAFSRSGTWRLNLKYHQIGQNRAELQVVDLQEPAGDSIMPNAADVAPQGTDLQAAPSPATGVSGQVVDPNSKPMVGAQVALITAKAGVTIDGGRLLPPRFGSVGKALIVETDAQGRFRFASEPNEGFSLIGSHDAGFARVDSDAFAASHVIRLEPWGRVEGQVAQGDRSRGDQILMDGLPNSTWLGHKHEYRYEGYCDAQGRFAFSQVPAGWFEVGYLTGTGDGVSSFTSRTPIVVKPGETVKVQLGGEGRPVIGRFVPPVGYSGTVYFGQGLRALATWRPEFPKPANYEQMTKRQQQEWYEQWRHTPEARAFYDAIWHDLNRRHYAFRINPDGTFRIEDVIAGKYTMTVYLEKDSSDRGPPEEDLGGYHGAIEVPPIPGGRSDEPLNVGDLVLSMREPPLKAGETAPLFEAKSLDGRDIRLADYRGRFVLLSFWQPVSHPELDRLKELHKTYGGTGKLAIIDLAGSDTLEEVRGCVDEHKIEWPVIYLGEKGDSDIARQYRHPVASYIVLVDPEGQIVATWLRGEKLTKAVREAIDANAQSEQAKTSP